MKFFKFGKKGAEEKESKKDAKAKSKKNTKQDVTAKPAAATSSRSSDSISPQLEPKTTHSVRSKYNSYSSSTYGIAERREFRRPSTTPIQTDSTSSSRSAHSGDESTSSSDISARSNPSSRGSFIMSSTRATSVASFNLLPRDPKTIAPGFEKIAARLPPPSPRLPDDVRLQLVDRGRGDRGSMFTTSRGSSMHRSHRREEKKPLPATPTL